MHYTYYYLRVQFSYVVWWCIVPSKLDWVLYLTRQHYMRALPSGEDNTIIILFLSVVFLCSFAYTDSDCLIHWFRFAYFDSDCLIYWFRFAYTDYDCLIYWFRFTYTDSDCLIHWFRFAYFDSDCLIHWFRFICMFCRLLFVLLTSLRDTWYNVVVEMLLTQNDTNEKYHTVITVPQYNINRRSIWRYQRGNHNPYIEEEQTSQWPKEKGQKGRKSLKIRKG